MNTKIKARQHARKKRREAQLTAPVEAQPSMAQPLPDQPIEMSMRMATDMWEDLRKRVQADPTFVQLKDAEKVAVYQKTKFKDFYDSFPIVCRYMLCMGQFNDKAFHRFLKKCEAMQPHKTPNKKRKEGEAEDEWVKRQADYVRYLWESYQKSHFNISDAQNVWQHAYKTLKKEFKDFKDMHADIEKKLEEDGKHNKSEMVKEMLGRIANEEQSLDEGTTKNLIAKLQSQLHTQRRAKMISQINADVDLVRPSRIAKGARKELKPGPVGESKSV